MRNLENRAHFKTRCLTARVMSEETQESNDCKLQLRLQKRREQRRVRFACETKDQQERRLQLRRHREQSRRAREASQETQKRLKAEGLHHVSRRQCERAKHRAHRLQIKIEGNVRCREQEPR